MKRRKQIGLKQSQQRESHIGKEGFMVIGPKESVHTS